MTKRGAKTVKGSAPRFEVALANDAGTTKGGMYGLTDLFMYANEFAARRLEPDAPASVRVTHWHADDGSSTIRCIYDSVPGSAHAPNVVIIPNNHRAIVEPEEKSPFIEWLRLKHTEGVVLAAVCGGVFMLAKTGLLAGRRATTHWSFSEDFSARFPDVLMEPDHMVIDYGDVLTAGGALAWADLGLRLTERFLGAAVMHDTARYMNVDPPGREQRFYSGFEPRTKHGDAAILKSQQWMSAQRERTMTVADIALIAGLEPRTFLRRFVRATGIKPSEYQRRLRIERARETLEFSRCSVEAVAASVGFNDVRAFRRIFLKIVGLTPSSYRRRFSRTSQQSVKDSDGSAVASGDIAK